MGHVQTAGALLVAGVAATAVRIVGQLLIPPGEQSVLEPSVFAVAGTMPLAFTVYGILAYSLIAGLFLLVRDRLPGPGVVRGLLFGCALSIIWTLYLLEPLPHVAPLDRITYPVADSAALLVLGSVVGALTGRRRRTAPPGRPRFQAVGVAALALGLLAARLLTYTTVGLYSQWEESPGATIGWLVTTAVGVALVLALLHPYLRPRGRAGQAVTLGAVLFGVDLILFNGFMPLVFTADMPDLVLRTAADVVGVTVGALAFARADDEAA